jgi:hypothetical protein
VVLELPEPLVPDPLVPLVVPEPLVPDEPEVLPLVLEPELEPYGSVSDFRHPTLPRQSPVPMVAIAKVSFIF